MQLGVTGVSGWVLVALLPLTITLPFLQRRALRWMDGGPGRQRMQAHYWLGYLIAVVVLLHAGVSIGGGVALHSQPTGLYLASGALALVVIQVFLGLLLREPSLRRRAVMQRRHFWVMVGIVVLALGHIAINSALVQRLVR